jgi:hypothetical protein
MMETDLAFEAVGLAAEVARDEGAQPPEVLGAAEKGPGGRVGLELFATVAEQGGPTLVDEEAAGLDFLFPEAGFGGIEGQGKPLALAGRALILDGRQDGGM